MGQATTIVLNDGSVTPVAVNFYPEQVKPEKTVFVDRRKTVRALQPSFTITYSPATAGRNTYRTSFSFEYPIEGVVNGVPAPVGVARYKDGDWIIPDIMPQADRKHLRAFVANAQGATLVKAYIEDFDPMY